jgi:hypothetical protein
VTASAVVADPSENIGFRVGFEVLLVIPFGVVKLARCR